MEDEIGEQYTVLVSCQAVLDTATVKGGRQTTAELNTILRVVEGFSVPHGHGLIYRPEKRCGKQSKGGTMGKAVRCECGELVQASTDNEIIDKVQAHVDVKHPDLIGKLTASDILAMAEEV